MTGPARVSPTTELVQTPIDIAGPGRLARIRRLDLAGYLGDRDLDAIVATVAHRCDVPIAVVKIVTPDEQTYLAEVGVGASVAAVPDPLSFSAQVVRTGRSFTVPDAWAHPVYSANPLVVAGVIGSYAGEPLVHGGHVIGALAMFDSSARFFTGQELAVLREQAHLASAVVRLRTLGQWDTLTGLASRGLLLASVQRALQARPSGQTVGLVVLDVVGMGLLNASLGSAGGDLVLTAVAERIAGACGPPDSVARICGDEFAVLLDEVGSVEEARARAAAICTAVQGSLLVEGVQVDLTVRCGLATTPCNNADELLAAAQRAAVEAPSSPGRPHSSSSPATAAAADLRRAIETDQLVLHYHPVVDLRTEQVVGVEALVRWQHPERGLLAPIEFIPFAEESGLIVPLGEWVLRTGATQAAAWVAAGRSIDVAINLSPVQMCDPGFADSFSEILSTSLAPSERIVLEVTESALLDQCDATRSLTQLRDAGVRLALDDFGTGYSSFSYLRRFPIDIIKIDRSFVAGLGRHPDDDAIVASVVGLARNTGKTVIAEGVETIDHVALLRRLGVQAGQGFFWVPPLPVDQVEAWIDAFAHNDDARAWSGARRGDDSWAVTAPQGIEETRILHMHADGASLHTIAAALNGAGLRTATGVRWHVRSVARVIAPRQPRAHA